MTAAAAFEPAAATCVAAVNVMGLSEHNILQQSAAAVVVLPGNPTGMCCHLRRPEPAYSNTTAITMWLAEQHPLNVSSNMLEHSTAKQLQ